MSPLPAIAATDCPVCLSPFVDQINADLLSGFTAEETSHNLSLWLRGDSRLGAAPDADTIRAHFRAIHLRTNPGIQLTILARMAAEERELERFLFMAREKLSIVRPNKSRLRRFEGVELRWNRKAIAEAEKALSSIRNRRLAIYRAMEKVSPEVQSQLNQASGLISDDQASRVMNSVMDRLLADPEKRALLEKKMGIAPAVEIVVEQVEQDDNCAKTARVEN